MNHYSTAAWWDDEDVAAFFEFVNEQMANDPDIDLEDERELPTFAGLKIA